MSYRRVAELSAGSCASERRVAGSEGARVSANVLATLGGLMAMSSLLRLGCRSFAVEFCYASFLRFLFVFCCGAVLGFLSVRRREQAFQQYDIVINGTGLGR